MDVCKLLTHSPLLIKVILTCTRPPLPSRWSRSPGSCPCSLPAPGRSQRSPCKCSRTSHLQSLLTPSARGTLRNRHRWRLISPDFTNLPELSSLNGRSLKDESAALVCPWQMHTQNYSNLFITIWYFSYVWKSLAPLPRPPPLSQALLMIMQLFPQYFITFALDFVVSQIHVMAKYFLTFLLICDFKDFALLSSELLFRQMPVGGISRCYHRE